MFMNFPQKPVNIIMFRVGTMKFFRVPTWNLNIFPCSNPEPGKFSGFQPGTWKFFQVPTRNRKLSQVSGWNLEIFPCPQT